MNKIISYTKKHLFLGAAVVFIGIVGVFICIEYGRRLLNSGGCRITKEPGKSLREIPVSFGKPDEETINEFVAAGLETFLVEAKEDIIKAGGAPNDICVNLEAFITSLFRTPAVALDALPPSYRAGLIEIQLPKAS